METPETQRQRPRRPRKRKYLVRKVRPESVARARTERAEVDAAPPAPEPVARAFPVHRYDMIRGAAERLAGERRGAVDPDRDWLEAEAAVEAELGRTRPF